MSCSPAWSRSDLHSLQQGLRFQAPMALGQTSHPHLLYTMLAFWRPLPGKAVVLTDLGGEHGPFPHRPFCGYRGGFWVLELEVLLAAATLGSRICGWDSGWVWAVLVEPLGGCSWGGWPFTPGRSWAMSLLWLGGVKWLVLTTDAMWTGEGELVLKMMRSSLCCDTWIGAGWWLGSGANLRSPIWIEPWEWLAGPWVMQGTSSLRSILAVRRSICSTTWKIMKRVSARPDCRGEEAWSHFRTEFILLLQIIGLEPLD